MTEKLKWRLSELPDAMGVAELVAQEVITPEEARDILFSAEDSEETSKKIKKLETEVKAKDEEIKFLRDLTDKLAARSNGWPTIIREYYDYKPRFPRWYDTYGGVMMNAKSNIADNNITTLTTGSGSMKTFTAGNTTVGFVNTSLPTKEYALGGSTQLLSKVDDKIQ